MKGHGARTSGFGRGGFEEEVKQSSLGKESSLSYFCNYLYFSQSQPSPPDASTALSPNFGLHLSFRLSSSSRLSYTHTHLRTCPNLMGMLEHEMSSQSECELKITQTVL